MISTGLWLPLLLALTSGADAKLRVVVVAAGEQTRLQGASVQVRCPGQGKTPHALETDARGEARLAVPVASDCVLHVTKIQPSSTW